MASVPLKLPIQLSKKEVFELSAYIHCYISLGYEKLVKINSNNQ
jgi:hypothetical protein